MYLLSRASYSERQRCFTIRTRMQHERAWHNIYSWLEKHLLSRASYSERQRCFTIRTRMQHERAWHNIYIWLEKQMPTKYARDTCWTHRGRQGRTTARRCSNYTTTNVCECFRGHNKCQWCKKRLVDSMRQAQNSRHAACRPCRATGSHSQGSD